MLCVQKICVSGNICMYICACGGVEEYVCVDMRVMCVSMYVCKSTYLENICRRVCIFSLMHSSLTYQMVQMPSLSPSAETKISPIDVH